MKFSLAPMLKVTTPQFRKLLRIISPDITLFTEMIPPEYIIRREDFLNKIGEFDENTIIQLGGNDPQTMCEAIKKIIAKTPFRMFNLNVGCPSPKVTKGCFGASMMLDPELIITIINHVFNITGIIMSVKCRIGVDEHDSYDFFANFIEKISKFTKCEIFYVHARKCWLDGLSPKDNRNIPILKYEYVHKIKKKFPNLMFHLNGGVKNIQDAHGLDGIMIGREAIKNVFVFQNLIKYNTIYQKNTDIELMNEYDKFNQIIEILKKYFSSFDENTLITHRDIVPLMNLFKGCRGNKILKRYLNILATQNNSVKEICFNKIKNIMLDTVIY